MVDLTKWVTIRKKPRKQEPKPARRVSGVLVRVLVDLPEGVMTPRGVIPPIKRGDLLNIEALGQDVARVLMERGVVEFYMIHGLEVGSYGDHRVV